MVFSERGIINFIFRKALEAANDILIKLRYSSNSKALTVKGEALYNMGDFEHALVCFHRAMKTASTKVILNIKYCFLRSTCLKHIVYLRIYFLGILTFIGEGSP